MRSFWLITAHCLLVLSLALTASAAEAQLGRSLGDPLGDPEPASITAADWVFDVSVATSLPLGWELEGQATASAGFFVRASVGHMPSPYLDAVASALGDAGVYRTRLRPVVDDIIGNGAWTVRAAVGWTAFDGLEVALGYTLLAAETSMRPDSVSAALNTSIPWPADMQPVPLTLRLHAISGRLGWRAMLDDAVSLRVALGWTHAFAVDSQLQVPETMGDRDREAATELESRLAEGLREYGFSPEIALSLGYRFQ